MSSEWAEWNEQQSRKHYTVIAHKYFVARGIGRLPGLDCRWIEPPETCKAWECPVRRTGPPPYALCFARIEAGPSSLSRLATIKKQNGLVERFSPTLIRSLPRTNTGEIPFKRVVMHRTEHKGSLSSSLYARLFVTPLAKKIKTIVLSCFVNERSGKCNGVDIYLFRWP